LPGGGLRPRAAPGGADHRRDRPLRPGARRRGAQFRHEGQAKKAGQAQGEGVRRFHGILRGWPNRSRRGGPRRKVVGGPQEQRILWYSSGVPSSCEKTANVPSEPGPSPASRGREAPEEGRTEGALSVRRGGVIRLIGGSPPGSGRPLRGRGRFTMRRTIH